MWSRGGSDADTDQIPQATLTALRIDRDHLLQTEQLMDRHGTACLFGLNRKRDNPGLYATGHLVVRAPARAADLPILCERQAKRPLQA